MVSCFFGKNIVDFLYEIDQQFQITDFFRFLRETIFGVKLGEYRHISLGGLTSEQLGTMIFCMTVAMILASCWLSHVRSKQGKFVRALLAADAMTPDTAKTLYDVGYFRDLEIRKSLASGNELHIAVKCVEEEAFYRDRQIERMNAPEGAVEPEGKKKAAGFFDRFRSRKGTDDKDVFRMGFTQAHFYIPEDLKYRAENRFSTDGFGTQKLILLSVATVVIAAIICRILPPVLSLADALLTLLE